MRVITAQESKIRTTERTIKTGGTVIRHVSGFTASAAKKTGNAVKNFDVQFNGGYDEENRNNNASEEKMPELQSVLAEESRALYGTLSRRQKKRYNKMYQKELSKKQWSSDIIKRNRNLRGNKTEKENILTVNSKSMVNKNVQTAAGTAAKSAGTAVRTTSGALTGTATFGVTAAVTAAVDAAKNAAQAAVKVSQKMQQQTVQTQQAKHETAAAVSDYSVSQAGENNNSIMLLVAAIICITVMLTSLTVTMQAAVDASGGQGDNNGTVCTQIVEAAQNELNDADKTVGGYRYKNWYGMDANMFVSYCADKCGFIEKGIMPKTASVAASKQWYINNNLYHDAASGYVPKAGDIIIFGNGMSHTGIVTGYNPETKKLTTIEGNSGRSSTTPYHKGSHVKEHTYSITYSKIAGYGTPQYPQDDTAADAAGQENN